MKKIKVVRITEDEKKELVKAYESAWKDKEIENPKMTLEEFKKSHENQTLSILKQLKNAIRWVDIERAVLFVDILKCIEKADDTFDLEDAEYKLIIEVFKDALDSGKIGGEGIVKIVQIYKEFLAAT